MFRARSARSKRATGEGEEKAVREDSKKETRKFRNWAQLKTSNEPKGCRLLQLPKMPILRISVKNIGNFFTRYLPSVKSDSFVSLLSDIYSSFQRFAATALKPKKL